MDRKPVVTPDRHRLVHAVDRLHIAILGVLETQKTGAGEVIVVRLDRCGDRARLGKAIGQHRHRLGLEAAEHRAASAFPAVGVGHVADDELVAPPAVGEQRAEIRLCATGDEDGSLLAEALGDDRLEAVDGRVVAEHVVADFGVGHRGAHRGSRLGDGVGAKIDHEGESASAGDLVAVLHDERRAGAMEVAVALEVPLGMIPGELEEDRLLTGDSFGGPAVVVVEREDHAVLEA